MKKNILIVIFSVISINAQNINLNNDYLYTKIRTDIIDGKLNTDYTLNIRPINYDHIKSENYKLDNYENIIFEKGKLKLRFLGLDYFTEFNSKHPYNRNNGSMIPNRGYQHIISPGFQLNLGPLSIKIKPEHHFSENKKFDGFWDGHYPIIWKIRYVLWNHLDIPERFGEKRHNRLLVGQSNIKLNFKNISFGISNENIWWGPSIRNSIMMSNHAEGFKHITLHTKKPLRTRIGNFEWQFITGRLDGSGYTPPRTDYEYAGTKLYVPKINQEARQDDWRYLQGYIISYAPKWVDGLSFGFIRWVQMYSALVRGKYFWMEGDPSYFPVFKNLLRSKDKFENYEAQTNEAAGLFVKWVWHDSNAEFYLDYHYNDAKQNLRDLLTDTDHSRAVTLGLQKLFKIKNNKYLFNWEWTQMEQNASRLVRNAGSWYEHSYVYHGYSNRGEVLGSSIGPGSNSQFFSLSRIKDDEIVGISLEVVDQDNDFYHAAFASAKDYRRYWKDFNFGINFNKKFNNFSISSRIIYIRSLNYQWELDEDIEPYYHAGKDVNNVHLNLKLTYFGDW